MSEGRRTFRSEWGRLGSAVAITLVLASPSAFVGVVSGGPLEPPGPPSPTMKTLEEVEPRTPISSVPALISTPGSYYLTGSLDCGSGACSSTSPAILIAADNVSLDLEGFTLSCAGVACSQILGIVTTATPKIVRIRNGVVRGFRDGVVATPVVSSVFEGLTLYDNMTAGIEVDGENNVIRDCVAQYNGTGIRMLTALLDGGGIVEGCSVMKNDIGIVAGSRMEVRDNTALANTDAGIIVGGSDNTVHGNNVQGNGTWGIRVVAPNNLIIRNRARGNGTNYSVVGGNTAGPIGPADTATSPWANLTY